MGTERDCRWPGRLWRGCRMALACLLLLGVTLGRGQAEALCLTGNARGNRNLRVPFSVQPEAARLLFDGSHLDRLSAGFPHNTRVILRFAEPVCVSWVTVVCYNDPPRTYNAALRGRVITSRGGAAAGESPWVPLDGDAVLLCGTDGALVLGSEAVLRLPGARAADMVAIDIEKRAEAHQCLVREVTVWGVPARLARAAAAPGVPIRFQAKENTYSSIRVTWQDLPPGTHYVRVRYRRQGALAWETACFTRPPGILGWVRPDAVYEVAAEAVGARPGRTRPVAQRVRLPHPLALRTMADAFGMNYYPGGGGAHQAHPDETANTRQMIELMRRAGVRHVRWWVPSPGGAALFAEAGMSLMPFVAFTRPHDYARLTETAGVWLAATQNEPDFSNTFADEYVQRCLPVRAAARRFSPLMLLAGPAVGGELAGPGSDYLAAAYAAGLRQALDVLDLHPYGKVSTPLSRGGVVGGPEGLLESLAACRETMRHAGASQQWIIASESGHPTHEGAWHMPPSSYERQAQWIVRTHLLLIASGVRRLFWYAFQDEGTDRRNPEHCFGIVDWHGRPKPAYETYRTMTRLLGDARCEGLERALKPPLYGVRCARREGYITALWDAGGRGEVALEPASGVTGVLSHTGLRLPLPRRAGGALVLPLDESVRYVLSSRPLGYVAQRRLNPPVAPRVHLSLSPTTVRVQPGTTLRWSARIRSEFDCPVRIVLDCSHPWGGGPAAWEGTLPARGRAETVMSLDAPEGLTPQIASWDVQCRYEPADSRWQPGEFRRALFFEVRPQP